MFTKAEERIGSFENYKAYPNLQTMFFKQAKKMGKAPFLWRKEGNNKYESMSWNETADKTVKLAKALIAIGLKRGDRVVLVSENRPEWLISDIAIMTAGGISVPAYTTNTANDHLHVINDSGAKFAIVSTAKLAKTLLEATEMAKSDVTVISMEDLKKEQESITKVLYWDTLLNSKSNVYGAMAIEGFGTVDIDNNFPNIGLNDTACLIYTSGTGGAPKGVMLTHKNMLSNMIGAYPLVKDIKYKGPGKESFLSFLPLSHSLEHTFGQFLPIYLAAQIYYAQGIDKISSNLQEAKPSIFISVPRLFEVIRNKVIAGMTKKPEMVQKLFEKSIELGREKYYNNGKLGLINSVTDKMLDKVVRKKIRQAFGGNLRLAASGGAPLNSEVGIFFNALGVTLLQGYGQTECSPAISFNLASKNKLHTVGIPLVGIEVRLGDDKEIIVRGDSVMKGYWRNKKATEETVDEDGWLYTGDIGVIDEDGFIEITDRKKALIVNSGGDNISSQRVEGLITLEPEFAQAMVYGDQKPHLVGVIVPDADFVKKFARENNVSPNIAELKNNKFFVAELNDAMTRVNKKLSIIEKVKKFTIAEEKFSIENEMLTPTLKIRRHAITKCYIETIESLYGKKGQIAGSKKKLLK